MLQSRCWCWSPLIKEAQDRKDGHPSDEEGFFKWKVWQNSYWIIYHAGFDWCSVNVGFNIFSSQYTPQHYNDVIMSALASQITNLTIVYSTVYSSAHQRKYQSCTSLAFVRGIHRWPVNSPHKRPGKRKMFLFDDVIMIHIRRNYSG